MSTLHELRRPRYDLRVAVGLSLSFFVVACGSSDASALDAGTVTVDGAANPLTPGSPLVSTSTKMIGTATGASFCLGLAGTVTEPVPTSLDPSSDIALGYPIPSTNAVAFIVRYRLAPSND